MTYQAILFDVDGTLLSISGREMMKEYLSRMAQFFDSHLAGQGAKIAQAVGAASAAMEKNAGEGTNEDIFWQVFAPLVAPSRAELEPLFQQFYREEFPKLGHLAKDNGVMPQIVQALAEKHYPLIVATNPLFPLEANQSRLDWAHVADQPWQEITCYEHYSHSKPDPRYFMEICQKMQLDPTQCLMIGNGLIEDVAATQTGMAFYLVTDEAKDGDPADYAGQKGSRADLLAFVQKLPTWEK